MYPCIPSYVALSHDIHHVTHRANMPATPDLTGSWRSPGSPESRDFPCFGGVDMMLPLCRYLTTSTYTSTTHTTCTTTPFTPSMGVPPWAVCRGVLRVVAQMYPYIISYVALSHDVHIVCSCCHVTKHMNSGISRTKFRDFGISRSGSRDRSGSGVTPK